MNRKELIQSALKGDPDAIRELRKQGVLKSSREPEKTIYPVSRAQRRLWVLSQTEQASIAYNIPEVLLMEGNLDRDIFERTFAELVRRHESLRTTFEYTNGKLYQKIHKKNSFKMHFTDLSGKAVPEECAPELIQNIITRPFDLGSGPLFSVSLLKLANTRHILVLSLHHIISDAWSMNILAEEFCAMYKAFRNGRDNPLQPLRIQYKDYAAWQNSFLEKEDIIPHQHYWHEKLSGQIPLLNLPTDFPRPPVRSFDGKTASFIFSSGQTEQLIAFSREKDVTLFITLITAVKVLLYRYTGQNDIIIGVPVAGRNHADIENQIGFYVNAVTFRSHAEGKFTFNEFLQKVKQTAAEAYDHQVYPIDRLADEIDLGRDFSRAPLFDVMMGLQENEEAELAVEGLRITPFEYENTVSKCDLVFLFTKNGNNLRLDIEYSTELFREDRIRRMGAHFSELAESILKDPDTPLGSLNILPESERNQVLYEFNNTAADYPAEKTIPEIFEDLAEKTPGACALVFKNQQITYAELNRRSNQLAHFLRKKGVSPDSIVAIMEDRGPEMIISILGVLKSGGAYLPVDMQNPPERIIIMLDDSKTKILLSREHLIKDSDFQDSEISGLKSNERELILLDKIAGEIASENSANPERVNQVTDLAYVIYTSGSTGIPKGVMIEHGGFVNMVFAQIYGMGITESDRMLQFASASFDASMYETFIALLNGAALVLISRETIADAGQFLRYAEEHQVTVMVLPPVYLNMLNRDPLPAVRRIITAGEPAIADDVRFYSMQKTRKYFNAYGPTETSVCASFYEVDPRSPIPDPVPIGKPIANSSIFILDELLNPVPIGIPGEICFSGQGVARGYLNQPGLTAEKFIDNLFDPGKRMYKIGDLGYWTPGGNVVFLGRKDDQVKIRGHRIEPDEIRSRLTAHSEIDDALVMVREGDSTIRELVAYIITSSAISPGEIRAFLGKSIPHFMIPSYFVLLEKFPLTISGKIDKKVLPDPYEAQDSACDADYAQPRDETEARLASIWQKLLGKERIGIHDNYFDLGGDSIKAIQVVSRLAQEGMKLEIRDLLLHPTIAGLSDKVVSTVSETDQGPVTGRVPLTAIQSWFFENHKHYPNHFNQSVMLYSKERLHEDGLRAVLKKIQEHHDVLRMKYKSEGGEIIQENCGTDYPLSFEVKDMRNSPDETEAYASQVQAGINLDTGPLMKVVLFRSDDGDHLMIIIHHLAVDGVSWRILFEDMVAGYKQYLSGKPVSFPLKTASFRLWARQVHQYSDSEELLKEKRYWKTLESLMVSPLPRDYEAADEESFSRDTSDFSLSREETGALLTKANHAYNTEISDILLTALARTMYQWHGGKKTVIALEGHGREKIADTDISRTVGWFTSMYPFALELPESDDPGYQIKYVKEMLRKVPNKGMGYGILKYVTSREHKQDMSFNSLPRICFNYLGQFDEDPDGLFQISDKSCGNDISPESEFIYDIDINSIVIRGQLQISLSYSQEMYKRETIEKTGTDLKNELLYVIRYCISTEDTEITPDDIDYDGFGIDELDSFLNNL